MEPEPHCRARGGLRRRENNGIQKLQAIRLSILPVSRLLIRLLYRVLILLQLVALSASNRSTSPRRSGWQCCSRCAWEVRPTAVTWNFTRVYCWRSTKLKSTGVSTQVDLFNTGRSEAEVRDLLRQNAVQQADLIIGPVYDDCFAPVAVFAAERGIPVVSPLASMNFAGGSLMFEAAPLQSAKYAKLAGRVFTVE